MADLSNPTRHGNTWHFADGTRVPVIAGGDETATPADINTVLDRIEGDTPADTSTGDAPATPAPADGDPYETGADNFDRAYVEKLRKESAKYRDERNQTRDELGRFTTAFEGWDDTARETFLNLPAALRDDPKGTAAWMRAEAERILEDATAEVDDPRDDAEDRPLTRKEVDRILAERDQQAAVADQVNTIYRELESLGVGKDTEQATAIMSIAASHTGGDITKAFYLMAQWAQEAVDKFVDGKKGDADRATRPTPATGNSAGPAEQKITSLKGARAGLEAYLEAQGVK